MRCRGCGTDNDDSTTFCTSCGYNLRLGAPVAEPTPGVPQAPEHKPVPVLSILKNALLLIASPTDSLAKNKDLVLPLKSVILNYLLVLAALPLIAAIISGVAFYGGDPSVFEFTVAYGLEVYALQVVGVIIMGAVIWKLAPFFGPATDQAKATTLVVYAAAPFFIFSLIDIIPYVGVLSYLALLYGPYILYKGLPAVLSTRRKRVTVFMLVVFGISVAVLVALAVVQYVVATALASALV